MKTELTRLLLEALKSLEGTLLPGPVDPESAVVERARDAQHGDFASHVALRLAKTARRTPRDLAQAIIAALPPDQTFSVQKTARALEKLLHANADAAALKAACDELSKLTATIADDVISSAVQRALAEEQSAPKNTPASEA